MPLPSTALTFHLDASDTDHIWTNYQAGTPFHNGVPPNDGPVQVWDDDDAKDVNWQAATAGTTKPLWRSSTPLMKLPCLDFDGTDDTYMGWNLAGTVAKPLSGVVSASAFVVLMSIRIEGGATNDADPFDNDGILADAAGYFGIHVKNNGGAYSLLAYNYDGSVDAISLSVSVDTNYVLVYWHAAGSIFAEVYDDTGLVASGNTASGDTGVLTGQTLLGKTGTAAAYYNGRIGEIAIYNAHDATDRGNAKTYFTDKWLTAAGGVSLLPPPNPMRHMLVR